MVQTEALRLFAAQGYHETSVEQIASAAAISPRTFYRYFPSKESVVLWDEYDDLPAEQLWEAHAGSDPYALLIRRLRELIGELYLNDRHRLLARTRLSFRVPEIRARFVDEQMATIGARFAYLGTITGASRDDLALAVNVVAVIAAMLVAMEHWQRHDGRPDLLSLIDEAIGALAEGAAHLRDAAGRSRAGTKNDSKRRPG